MPTLVCLSADTVGYPEGGGHMWAYLNWALGLRALGCEVIWLEGIGPEDTADARAATAALQQRLEPYGLAQAVAVCSRSGQPLPPHLRRGCLGLAEAAEADLLLNFRYGTPPEVVERFRRSALLDIDPGLLQLWLSRGQIAVARHDVYLSTGETVGQAGARFPDGGLEWHYTPPCVALDWWPVSAAEANAPFTTVSHWEAEDWVEDGADGYRNDKRSGFVPFLDLPRHTRQPLELALCLPEEVGGERAMLGRRGWRVQDAHAVASTPWDYQAYVQQSRGEFSCAKPSCGRLQNAWVSDRTLCYLASGKPAIVEHTGPSRVLPDAEGLFRFHDLAEAARCLEIAAQDYERHCRLARQLVEDRFDARKLVADVLTYALN